MKLKFYNYLFNSSINFVFSKEVDEGFVEIRKDNFAVGSYTDRKRNRTFSKIEIDKKKVIDMKGNTTKEIKR